ncbi:UNVERIFIED_CONTAM: Retrovirus-related Pol polyprotein from transposon gypsy [Sesamum calycinum]|uniref:Retrovirus-related Pol polyprotein from transposon gypsy n=1 Tax=Sesamum calycinum TaxID=2727403 RepID=A0AAW2NVU4_9LAMI
MPGLDLKVVVHHLSVKKGAHPVKQGQRRFRPEIIPLVQGEVNKLIEVSFIREVKDLNNACPKDDFPLPIAELMIDATKGHEALSFMDGSSGYNQVRMAQADEELTAFCTSKGIYCYKVMPFGLKNAGSTYQKAMQKIFNGMLHKNIECYVDDLVVNSLGSSSASGGIKIEQVKIDVILRMPKPRNIHELKSLQGKLAYLQRFISNLAGCCQSFSYLMKKDVPFQWDEACDNAFKSIKSYLRKHPVFVAPIPGRPLILYIVAQERSVGILFAQKSDEERKCFILLEQDDDAE